MSKKKNLALGPQVVRGRLGCRAPAEKGIRPRLSRAQTALLRETMAGLTLKLDELGISPDQRGFVMYLSRSEVERLQELRELLADKTAPAPHLQGQRSLPGLE